MIIWKYSKLNGAEYVSHLDTLRALIRTMRRMRVAVKYSEGFNPHMELYMSSPVPVGLATKAEFAAVDGEYDGDFIAAFNACSPDGFTAEWCARTNKNPNFAAIIDAAEYEIVGINDFDVRDIMNSDEFICNTRRGEENMRSKIISLKKSESGALVARLAAGNTPLRADNFISALIKKYGGETPSAVKTRAFSNGTLIENLKF